MIGMEVATRHEHINTKATGKENQPLVQDDTGPQAHGEIGPHMKLECYGCKGQI